MIHTSNFKSKKKRKKENKKKKKKNKTALCHTGCSSNCRIDIDELLIQNKSHNFDDKFPIFIIGIGAGVSCSWYSGEAHR